MSDELKVVLDDVKEKFDTVIEAFNTVKERLDRHEKAQEEHLERIESRLIELGHDLNGHRNNTELNGQRKRFLTPFTERTTPPFAHFDPKVPPGVALKKGFFWKVSVVSIVIFDFK